MGRYTCLVAALLFCAFQVNAKCTRQGTVKAYVCVGFDIEEIQPFLSNTTEIVFRGTNFGVITKSTFWPFGNIKKLSFYDCIISKIEDDAFDGLRSVEALSFRGVKLTNLKGIWFKNMVSLQVLDLVNNHLKSCTDIQILTDLEHIQNVLVNSNLDLDKSCMDEFKRLVRRCQTLPSEKFVCKHVHLRALTRIPASIKQLEISDTHVNEITMLFRFANTLEYLGCSNCNISSIDQNVLSRFPRLQELYLQGNNITELDGTFFKNSKSLKKLDLSNNGLKSCVNTDHLRDLVSIQAIYYFDNPHLEKSCSDAIGKIADSPCIRIYNGEYACSGVTVRDILNIPGVIYRLYIEDTPVNTITSHVFSRHSATLEYLECRNCNITSIEDNVFIDFQNLVTLNLEDNRLETIRRASFEGNTKLKEIILSNNAITNIESAVFREWPNMKLLQVSGNYLKCLDFGMLSYWKGRLEIYMYDNENITNDCKDIIAKDGWSLKMGPSDPFKAYKSV